MESSRQDFDVLIIGAGLAGLAAATFLARQGKRVHLLEQAREPGGRARTQNSNGYYLNMGPHAVYRGGRGIDILRELGVTPRGAQPPVSGGYAIDRWVKHTLPVGPFSLLTTGLFGMAEKIEAARLVASISKLEGDPFMGVSVQDWVNREIRHPKVRDFALALFRLATYIHAPESLSAGVAIEQLKLAVDKGVLYLDHGWQSLVNDLTTQAKAAGASIEASAKVKVIERDAASVVRAVRLADGRVYRSPAILVAAGPQEVTRLLDGGPRTSVHRWAETAVPVKAACLDVGLKRLPEPGATFAMGIDGPFYLSVHSAVARIAPEAGAVIHVARYLTPHEKEASEVLEHDLERLLDIMQPGWRAELVQRRFLPTMTVSNALPSAAMGGTRGRPDAQIDDAPGLFIAGDWVGGEGLLADASLASAKRAAEAIAGYQPASAAAA